MGRVIAQPTRLRRGQRFSWAGGEYRVLYVNESRAHCMAVHKQIRQFTDRNGKTVAFQGARAILDISPTTSIELLAEFTKRRMR